MTKRVAGVEEFKKLPLEEQLNRLHKDGVHIGKRKVEDKTTILFQINDFYAEVYYKLYRQEVDRIIISADIEILQPYLGQIRIQDLDKDNE